MIVGGEEGQDGIGALSLPLPRRLPVLPVEWEPGETASALVCDAETVMRPSLPANMPFLSVLLTLNTYSLSSGPICIGGASGMAGTTRIFLAASASTATLPSRS